MLFTLMVGTVFTILLVCYFFPYFVALGLSHPRDGSIAALNLLLGWTAFGWFATLFWALKTNGKPKAGRIIFLLIILATLGYLFAYYIAISNPDVAAHFDAVVTAK
jgi:hypothetical protein